MTLTRSEALALMQEYTASDALRKHMYAVEIAMRAMAERAGEDPEASQRAILGHASYTGVPRESAMAKALFAVDELCGFLVACALVRPSRSLQDLEVASVRKKLKDKAFARGVNRDDVIQGAAEIGVPLDEHIAFVLAALRPHEHRLGLGAA